MKRINKQTIANSSDRNITRLLILAAVFLSITVSGQNGYIYVHKKTINEAASLNFDFTLKNSAATTIKTFTLSDKPDNYNNVYDVGAGHNNGAGALWAIAGTTNNGVANTGSVYVRTEGSAIWTPVTGVNTTNGNPSAIDGAYLDQFVYISGGRVYFYYNGTSTQIYTGTDAKDVAAANGKIALTTNGSNVVKTWNGVYGTGGITTSSTAWTNRTITGNAERIDMDSTGVNIVYINNTAGLSVYTIGFANGTATSLNLSDNTARPGSTNTPGVRDIAWADDGTIYSSGSTSINSGTGSTDIVYSYISGTWTSEPEARGIQRLTGGTAGQAWGVVYEGTGFAQAIWSRTNDGTHLWIDDERVKNSTTLYGDAVMIEVPAGTYTLSEPNPNSNWDLGRFNIYDPSSNTTGNVLTNTATIKISAGEVVHIEYINELLIPKAVQLNCTEQYLQSFDGGSGSNQFGSGTYGTYVEGTSYHYFAGSSPQDGYYTVLKSLNGQWFVSNSPDLTDHTANGGYFMLVNAAYGRDEFYRQRMTNLVPGVKYSISFWAADALGANPIRPNISYGMQDLNGNIYGSSSTGDIYTTTTGSNTAVWRNYYIVFTQPNGITTADLFLKNNNIGGVGNDLAIDDITLNPVLEAPNANIYPALLCTAPFPYDFKISNPQTGGIWSSSNTSVAAVDPLSGVITSGLVKGSAVITYFLINSVGCITTATSSIVVNQSPAVKAAANTTAACVGQVVNLSSTASAGTAPYTYAWAATPAAGSGLGTSNIQNTTASPTVSGNIKYGITVTDAIGCKGTDSAAVAISTGTIPTVIATATAVPNALLNVCAGANTVNLGAVPAPLGSYTYTWTGSGITNPNTQITTALPTVTGGFSVNAVNSQGCYASATTSAITVWPSPSVNPQPSLTRVCRNQTVTLSSNLTGGSGSSALSYAWTRTPVTNNTITTATSTNPLATYTTGATGTYTYSLSYTDTKGCTATGSTAVIVTNNTTAAPTLSNFTASPNPICALNTLTLGVTKSGGTGSVNYYWTGDGIVTSPTTTTSTTALPATATTTGTYSVQVTDANGCSASLTSNTVTVRTLPEVSIATNTSKTCLLNTINLSANITKSTTANYTYTWTQTTGGGLASASTGPTSSIAAINTAKPLATGNYSYTVKVADTYGCTSQITAASTTTVSFGAFPIISSIGLSATSVCPGSLVTLTPIVSSGTSPYAYFWSGSAGAGLNNANVANATGNPTVDANYALLVIDDNGCSATKQTSTIVVNPNPAIVAQSDNASVCPGSPVSLTSTPSGGSGTYSTFLWTASAGTAGGLGTNNIQNTTANPTAAGDYTVKVTDSKGCSGTNMVSVTINPVPTVTTPTTSQNVCSGTAMTGVVFSGSISTAVYSWTRDNGTLTTGSVTGIAANGTGDISGTPVNTTSSPVTVKFTVTPTANGCSGTPITVTMVVNPNISVVLSGSQTICPANTAIITLTSAGPFPFNVKLSNAVTYTLTSSPYNIPVTPATTTTYSITTLLATTCASGGGTSGTAVVTVTGSSSPIGTWICGADNDWFNPCNWGKGVVPDNTIDVTIPNTAPCSPVINPASPFAPLDKIARSKEINIGTSQNLSFSNGGDLYVAGDWINKRGSAGFTANTGTVTFMGTSAQSITTKTGATEAFYNLKINNASNLPSQNASPSTGAVTLNNPATVSGVLTLTKGIVKTDTDKLLTILNTSTNAIAGGSTSSYIWGPIARNTNTTGNYNYPVGNPYGPSGQYRPAITAPDGTGATTYQVEYKITLPDASLDNRGGYVSGILNSEHWQVDRTSGSTNAVIELPYINPGAASNWTSNTGPCSSCNVAIVTTFGPSSLWYFTNGTNLGTGFNTSLPEARSFTNDGLIYSKLVSGFGDFTFGFAYSIILPVKLLSFEGKLLNGGGKLDWKVADDKDLDGFVLEYSRDGSNFGKLSIVNANAGVSAYAFNHTGMQEGSNYYRLLIKEKSGNQFYSKTVLLNSGRSITQIRGLRPTMVKNETFVAIKSIIPQVAHLTLIDAAGRTVGQYKSQLLQGENSFRITTNMLANGVYMLNVKTEDGVLANLRFIKE